MAAGARLSSERGGEASRCHYGPMRGGNGERRPFYRWQWRCASGRYFSLARGLKGSGGSVSARAARGEEGENGCRMESLCLVSSEVRKERRNGQSRRILRHRLTAGDATEWGHPLWADAALRVNATERRREERGGSAAWRRCGGVVVQSHRIASEKTTRQSGQLGRALHWLGQGKEEEGGNCWAAKKGEKGDRWPLGKGRKGRGLGWGKAMACSKEKEEEKEARLEKGKEMVARLEEKEKGERKGKEDWVAKRREEEMSLIQEENV